MQNFLLVGHCPCTPLQVSACYEDFMEFLNLQLRNEDALSC